SDFNDLENALSTISNAICSVRVSVTKLVDEDANGTYEPQNAWNFQGTVTVSPGANDRYRWLAPGAQVGPPSGGHTRIATSAPTPGVDGRASFEWLPSPTTLTSQIQIAEQGRDATGMTDYHFVGVTCAENGTNLPVPNQPTITLAGLQINDDI